MPVDSEPEYNSYFQPLSMQTDTKPTYRSLKAWRKAARLSTRKAAELLGMSQSKYMTLELRRRYLKGPEAKDVEGTTGVPLETLVGAR